MALFNQLKRRNVIRVGVACLALGWVVVQITSTLAPAMRLPDWTVSFVFWVGLIGLPFVLLFSWAYELTPEGLKRESGNTVRVTAHVIRTADSTHLWSETYDRPVARARAGSSGGADIGALPRRFVARQRRLVAPCWHFPTP